MLTQTNWQEMNRKFIENFIHQTANTNKVAATVCLRGKSSLEQLSFGIII